VRNARVATGVALVVGACGGGLAPNRTTIVKQVERISCPPNQEPMVVGFDPSIRVPNWVCAPICSGESGDRCIAPCPSGNEYVTWGHGGENALPNTRMSFRCVQSCEVGWRRAKYLGNEEPEQFPYNRSCALVDTDCQPETGEANAIFGERQAACRSRNVAAIDERRGAHPGMACMSDCRDLARTCLSNCNGTGRIPPCLSDCQERANSCADSCRGMQP
jgi:hypothetical protein